MMIKYKVHEVSKDLGVPAKKISEVLEKYCGVVKKSQTSLEENELDVIFDFFTQERNADSFDAFFSKRNEAIRKEEEKKDAEKRKRKEELKNKKAQQRSRQNKQEHSSNNKDNAPKKQPVEDKKPQEAKPETAPAEQPKKENKPPRKKESRVIDTSAVVVNVDKYNEKYDNMADSKMNRSDRNRSQVKKQKINQKSQQRKKRQGRHETEKERLRRIAEERKAKPITVQIPDEIVVQELAVRLKATVAEVVKKAFLMGTMVTATDTIDFDTASLIAMEFHAKVEKEVVVTIEERIIDDTEDEEANLVERAPVVVVMGHVDHGKTSILDVIRNANVTASEAGGITQHIGAYRVSINGKDITFLDTPGHEAFTTMRARGAQATDIAILVVAADDGIMPQTIEAINHAKAANVSIIVAINKMDKPGANPEQVKQQLTEYGLVPEEWGGDVPCIPVSAKTKQGIEDLLEMVLLVAEVKELRANPDRRAKGCVIEARLDKGRGPIATVLVQNGTLRKGDILVAGTAVGRVRAMTNDKGRTVHEAGPSVPVEITGLAEVPQGGDIFNAVSDERLARELVEERKAKQKEELFNSRTKVTLDNLFDKMKQGEMKELQIIVKADVQGSVEAVRQSLEKLSNDEVRVNVIHGGVGAINESDVMLANAGNAIIVGFNVRPDATARANAERDSVEIRLYSIIYSCIEEIEAAMKGMLAPKTKEVILGNAEIRNIIRIKSVGIVAGSYVKNGVVKRNASVRVIRDGVVIAEDTIASLQRFKDAVKEVAEGYECGICLEKYNDLREGDIFEVYEIQEYREE